MLCTSAQPHHLYDAACFVLQVSAMHVRPLRTFASCCISQSYTLSQSQGTASPEDFLHNAIGLLLLVCHCVSCIICCPAITLAPECRIFMLANLQACRLCNPTLTRGVKVYCYLESDPAAVCQDKHSCKEYTPNGQKICAHDFA